MCAVHVAYFTLHHLYCCNVQLSKQLGVPEHLEEYLMFVAHPQYSPFYILFFFLYEAFDCRKVLSLYVWRSENIVADALKYVVASFRLDENM